MKPLPRPVHQVLDAPTSNASVMRVWARVQLRRRVPAPLARPWLVFAGVAAALVFVVATRPVTRTAEGAPAQAAVTPSDPPERAASWLRGRHALPSVVRRASERAVGEKPPPEVPVPAQAEPALDVVGALLDSADEAWRAGHAMQASVLLGEVVEHHGDDPRAGEALFVLGLVQLDALNQPKRAVATLRRALEVGVAEDLVGPLWDAYERAEAAVRDAGGEGDSTHEGRAETPPRH